MKDWIEQVFKRLNVSVLDKLGQNYKFHYTNTLRNV